MITLLALCHFAWAGSTGSISGTVTDPTGAVIAAAAVTLRNSHTGALQTAITGNDGSFSFLSVPVGDYQLEIRAPGFKPYVRSGLEVNATASLQVDSQLVLNGDSELVEVSVVPPGAETSSTQLGEVISEERMSAIPLNGRSFTDLLALQAGVVPVSSQQPNAVQMSGCTSTSPSGDLNPGNMSVSGQRETANGFVLNGANVEETFNMGAAVVPNLDAVQEFRVITSNFDAQYGNFSGGQVWVTTKSGTNEFHGSAFEFLRNTALDARNYFSADRAKYDQNQFGGTFGGPIKKDKVFFFMDYQGTRLSQGLDTGRITVPSKQDRTIKNGYTNVSDLAGQLTGQVNGQGLASSLSQKLGYTVANGEPYYSAGCTSTSQCVFPGALIPQSAWSGPAQNLLQYIPAPNQGTNVFSTSVENQALRDDKAGIRIDANTAWGNLSTYYSLDDYFRNDPYPTEQGGASVPGFNALTFGRSQLLSLSLAKPIGTSAVNEIHFSYIRDANVVGTPQGGVGPSLASQGFVDGSGKQSIYAMAPQIEGVENVQFNDFSIGVDTTGLTEANNTYQWADDFSKILGKHTVKFGGGLHLDQININPDSMFNGSFYFTGYATGSDFVDFLLGLPSGYNQADSGRFYLRNKYIGLYGQDSWRAKPNLTLNYGLRWDVLPAWHEKYNQIQTLALGQQSVVYPGAPRGLVFPGDPGIPNTLAPTKYKNFVPRLGLAYSPNFGNGLLQKLFGNSGTTSIRAAYGIYYTAFEGLSAGIMSANPPYGYDYTSLAPPTFADPFVNAATGQGVPQPFPEPILHSGASASHPNSTVPWNQFLPITGVPSFYRRNVPPYAETYSLTVQREIVRDTVLSVGYVGSQSHHQLVLISANPGNPAECLALDAAGATPTCGPFGEANTYTLPNGQTVEGTRGPFSSQFDAVTYQKTIGSANYNALQVNLRHHSGPLELLVGYTYSKSIDESSSLAEPVNPIDPLLSRAISAFDLRNNFVASYKYNVPIPALFRHDNRWTKGWAISGITRFSSGLPVTLFNNTDSSLLGSIPNGINNNGIDTPNVAPGDLEINTNPRNRGTAFNTGLFCVPGAIGCAAALGQMGNVPRRFFYGPGLENFDVALHKVVVLTESKSLEFRVEAFNVFNHAQFFGPATVNGNISSSNFGWIVNADAPREVQLAAKFSF
jgi:hypothetical protein